MPKIGTPQQPGSKPPPVCALVMASRSHTQPMTSQWPGAYKYPAGPARIESCWRLSRCARLPVGARDTETLPVRETAVLRVYIVSGGAETADCSARGSLQQIHPWGSHSILGAPQRQGSRSHEPGGGSQPEAQGVGLAGGGPRGAVPHLPRPDCGHHPRPALQAHLLQGLHPAVGRQQRQLPPVPPEDPEQTVPGLAPLGSPPDPPAPGKAAAHQGAAGEKIGPPLPQRPSTAQPLQVPPPAGAQLLLARGAQPAQPLRGATAGGRGPRMAQAGGAGAADGRRRARAAPRLVSGRPDLSRERHGDGKSGRGEAEAPHGSSASAPADRRFPALPEKTTGSSSSSFRPPLISLGQPTVPGFGPPLPPSRALHRAQQTAPSAGRTQHLRYDDSWDGPPATERARGELGTDNKHPHTLK